jgi:hypothetical protein
MAVLGQGNKLLTALALALIAIGTPCRHPYRFTKHGSSARERLIP